MKRWQCVAAIAVSFVFLETSPAWASFQLSASLDSQTLTIDTTAETVTASVTVFCDNSDPDASLVVVGNLLQPLEETNKTRVASSAEVRTSCLGEQMLTLVFTGPFHPGMARFQLMAEACIDTTIATCDATKEQQVDSYIRVRLEK
jgi:hypothetical protein